MRFQYNVDALSYPTWGMDLEQTTRMQAMTIKAIRMLDGGFITQPFAFGGEEGKEAFIAPRACPEGYESLELKRVMKLA